MVNIEVFVAFLAVIISVFTLYKQIKNNRLSDLDNKSGWRQRLMDIAGSDEITIKDVYTVRATLRYAKHNSGDAYSFKRMSDSISDYCDCLTAKNKRYLFLIEKSNSVKNTANSGCLNYEDAEIIRICARYLLKNYWGFFERNIQIPFIKYFKISSTDEHGKKTIDMILKKIR